MNVKELINDLLDADKSMTKEELRTHCEIICSHNNITLSEPEIDCLITETLKERSN